MRTLTDHVVDGDSVNHQVTISVLDDPGDPGAGGANHVYKISWDGEPVEGDGDRAETAAFVRFQNGPIKEFGVNGVTQEALITICIDRLRSFQAGPFACDANLYACVHLCEALRLLQQRTRARIARGVEGTHQK